MLALTANLPAPTQVSLVATPLPNTEALRVPSTNVSPSTSSYKTESNLQGGAPIFSESGSVSPLPIPIRSEGGQGAAQNYSAYSSSFSPSSGFLVQLAGGESSEISNKVLAQYETLVSYGFVKYKPSDASKPSEPESVAVRPVHTKETIEKKTEKREIPKAEVAKQVAVY